MISLETIQTARDEAIENVSQVIAKCPWDSREFYSQWLAQTYFYVCHTTRNLALACAKMPMSQTDMHNSFIHHITEEKGHEKLAYMDLKNLGFKMDQFEEFAETSALYQSMHYLIAEVSPMSILGYALVLEGFAANRAQPVYDKLVENYGAKCATFLKVHIIVDAEHSQESNSVIEQCNEKERDAILKSIKLCEQQYISFYRKLNENLSQKNAYSDAVA
jgi:hypothetical protein